MGEKSCSDERELELKLIALRSCYSEQIEIKDRLISVNSRLQGSEITGDTSLEKKQEPRSLLEKLDYIISDIKSNNSGLYTQISKLENII